jgi:hypothetical protein
MAGLIAEVKTASISLAAATKKTVLQITAPSTNRLRLRGWSVYFNGTAAAAVPVTVELIRQSDAGTSGDSVTPQKKDDSISDSVQFTVLEDIDGTQPTEDGTLKRVFVHPQFGYEFNAPFGHEDIIGQGDRIGIACTAPAAVSVVAWCEVEE